MALFGSTNASAALVAAAIIARSTQICYAEMRDRAQQRRCHFLTLPLSGYKNDFGYRFL
jgi:hypothetical protein